MNPNSVIVTGPCWVPGLASSLALCLPKAEVIGFAPWQVDDNNVEQIAEKVRQADVWITSWSEHQEAIEQLNSDAQVNLLRIPTVIFSGFHPDIVYARDGEESVIRMPVEYKSAISIWAWKHGVSVADTVRLFRDDVMLELGYDKYWESAVDGLRAEFAASDIAFEPFWNRLKRLGVFMHSFNHPTAAALSLLAKAIAVQLGQSAAVWDDPIERYIGDRLDHIVWPIYPFIGSQLGLLGSYRWRVGQQIFHSLEEWVSVEHANLDNFRRTEVTTTRDQDEMYDDVLGSALTEARR